MKNKLAVALLQNSSSPVIKIYAHHKRTTKYNIRCPVFLKIRKQVKLCQVGFPSKDCVFIFRKKMCFQLDHYACPLCKSWEGQTFQQWRLHYLSCARKHEHRIDFYCTKYKPSRCRSHASRPTIANNKCQAKNQKSKK